MLKSEFELLAGRNVTDDQYTAIEILYMSSNLEKTEFVKSIRYVNLVDVDIATGKYIIKPLEKEDLKKCWKETDATYILSTGFDFDYEDCIYDMEKTH